MVFVKSSKVTNGWLVTNSIGHFRGPYKWYIWREKIAKILRYLKIPWPKGQVDKDIFSRFRALLPFATCHQLWSTEPKRFEYQKHDHCHPSKTLCFVYWIASDHRQTWLWLLHDHNQLWILEDIEAKGCHCPENLEVSAKSQMWWLTWHLVWYLSQCNHCPYRHL